MGMDLSKVKAKLAAMTQGKGKKDWTKENEERKKIREKNFWVPPVGKTTIRIVPSKFDKTNPFQEVYFHYGIGKRTLLSLTNFGEKDPIDEFSKQLKDLKDKESWTLGRKLEPKMRTFVPIIVRGEEEKGVRYWEFGSVIYKVLLALAEDEDVGDYTDIVKGRDFTVTTVGKESTGTGFNQSTINIKMKETPLSTDKNLVKKWLEEQNELLPLYEKVSYDKLKETLLNWLESSNKVEESKPSEDKPAEKEKSNYSLSPKKETKEETKEEGEEPDDSEEEDELDLLFKN